jgi:hypothetical protein
MDIAYYHTVSGNHSSKTAPDNALNSEAQNAVKAKQYPDVAAELLATIAQTQSTREEGQARGPYEK